MNNINVLGIDLAKDVFQLCGLSHSNKVKFNKSVRRCKLLDTVLQHAGATLALEACGSAHHWARLFKNHGFKVILVPAQFVKGFTRGNKNDAKDALAIAESALRPELHPVQTKSLEQQDYQTLLRYRSRQIELRVSTSNQARGILAEYGVVFPKSNAAFMRSVPDLLADGDNDLTPIVRKTIQALFSEFLLYQERIADLDKELHQIAGLHPTIKSLTKLRGIGPITAVALFASIGHGRHFRNGRQLAAWIGLVPKQFSTGGNTRLGEISKRGNQYLRTLLIHGARTVMNWIKEKSDGLSLWIKQLVARRGKHKAIVAIANKTARMIWVVLNKGIECVPTQHLSTS